MELEDKQIMQREPPVEMHVSDNRNTSARTSQDIYGDLGGFRSKAELEAAETKRKIVEMGDKKRESGNARIELA